MTVDTRAQTTTWTFLDGDWHEGNPPIIGPRSHAFWLGSTVFDGARWFEGVAPDLDLHCQRVNHSAGRLGLSATVAAEETALERLAEIVADQMVARLALYASSRRIAP